MENSSLLVWLLEVRCLCLGAVLLVGFGQVGVIL